MELLNQSILLIKSSLYISVNFDKQNTHRHLSTLISAISSNLFAKLKKNSKLMQGTI
jgi:hypothetical protein